MKRAHARTRPGYSTQPIQSFPDWHGGTNRIGKEAVVKKKTIYLPINPGNGADLRYNGDERSDTDEICRGKRYRQKK